MLTHKATENPVCQSNLSRLADQDADPASATASTAQKTPSGRPAA